MHLKIGRVSPDTLIKKNSWEGLGLNVFGNQVLLPLYYNCKGSTEIISLQLFSRSMGDKICFETF